jgi:hypothetical protein
MKQAKWIWAPKAFELYHGMLLHNRRTISGTYHPPMWRIDSPARNVFLYKTAFLDKEETFVFHSNTKNAAVRVNGSKWYPEGSVITVPKGKVMVKVNAYKDSGFPAFYIEGDTFASDESWRLGSYGGKDDHAGYNDMYTSLDDDPEIFKFAYKRIIPISFEKTENGVLYDFGKECFGKIILNNVYSESATFSLYCGESREEALDIDKSIIKVNVKCKNGEYASESVAFRFVFVPDFGGEYDLSADFEYLPIENRGSFRSDDMLVNKIYDIAVYTLGLNSREGYLDGIKRDRWVWGGDAYQSFLANYYLAFDTDTVRRTQRILHGNDPITMHINTIPDYSFYWIISLWEYYIYTGDKDFIASAYGDMRSLFDFAEKRLNNEGLYKRDSGDWVFVDWTEHFDKDAGPICAEQMLLCRAYECAAECAELLADEVNAAYYRSRAQEVRKKINALYWDDEKKAFIDDYTTGNRNVTRHANIFAILYDLTTKERKDYIIENVIKNNSIPAIITPYFKFFELAAMCEIEDFSYVIDMIRSYWGGMVAEGATTFWEKYEPDMSGAEHYEMYGQPYGKSLCHAWGGTTPIYLLGKYFLGVRPTAANYMSFEVRPCAQILGLGNFFGKVPTPHGDISVKICNGEVTVLSDLDGGKLVLDNNVYAIEKGKELKIKIQN